MYRRKNKQTRLIILSADERDKVLDKAHRGEIFDEGDGVKDKDEVDDRETGRVNDENHCDLDASVAAIEARYFWNGIALDVANWVSSALGF